MTHWSVVACRALVMLLLASSTCAFALDVSTVHGIWKGTLGTQDVTICLSADTVDYYYYDRFAMPLKLVRNADAAARDPLVLNEFPPPGSGTASSGTWTLRWDGHARLQGTWSSGARQLPIDVRLAHDATTCDSAAFTGKIHFPVSVVAQDPTTAIKYRVVSYVDAGELAAGQFDARFQLLEKDPVSSRINAELLSTAPGAMNSCPSADGTDDRPSRGSSDLTPTFVSAHWVYASWDAVAGSCGTAQLPRHGRRLWNRTSGAKIDSLWDWFSPRERTLRQDDDPLTADAGPRLAAVLSKAIAASTAAAVADDLRCDASTLMTGHIDVDLEDDGFVFWIEPPRPCLVRVADADIEPLLTDRGRADLHSIRADLRHAPRRGQPEERDGQTVPGGGRR